jgi:thiol:disulfide interchange protein DsbD
MACLLLLPGASDAAESTVLRGEGLTLRLVSDCTAVVPGSKVTVGLFIEHDPGYHTYWRSPGMVGMATALHWKLPEGARAGDIIWPGPMRTKMAGITAWGYEEDTCLLTEIKVPTGFQEPDFRVEVEAAWMCCARTCHPGFEKLELAIPVGSGLAFDAKWTDVIAAARERVPASCPENWEFALLTPGLPKQGAFDAQFELPASVELPRNFAWEKIYFFADDNQVDSDAEQQVHVDPKHPRRVALSFQTTAFAPENPPHLGGVLFHPDGWPGLETCWIRVSAVWKGN